MSEHCNCDHSWNLRPATLPRMARVTRIRDENYRTRTFELDLNLDAHPGQFVMAWLPGLDEKPFSLSSADPVSLTVACVGPFSGAMHALVPGDRVGIRGPFGHGFRPLGPRALLVGGGYGAAPLAYLAESLLAAGTAVTAVLGARSAADLILVHRFERLGLDLLLATEDGSYGLTGRATDVAGPMLRDRVVDALYACGPHPMLETLEGIALAARVPAQLSWEARMRCGIGVCGSCEHHGMLLCSDGPVLPAGC